MTPAMLDAVARFGHAGTWAFLANYLVDPMLAPAASRALATLFGDCVSGDDRLDANVWELAIAKLGLDPRNRYRRGRVWSIRLSRRTSQTAK